MKGHPIVEYTMGEVTRRTKTRRKTRTRRKTWTPLDTMFYLAGRAGSLYHQTSFFLMATFI